MDKDKARLLSYILWKERLQGALWLVILAIALLAFGALLVLDSHVTRSELVYGRVDRWSMVPAETGSGAQLLWVTLDSGAKVMAKASREGRTPRNGEYVELIETHKAIGRVGYEWTRKEPARP
jgi:hypothetical protein